jgi:hypothetical protein
MNVAWYFHDKESGNFYYTESYTMSVTNFASEISEIVGYTVIASDISAATNWKEVEKRNPIHI